MEDFFCTHLLVTLILSINWYFNDIISTFQDKIHFFVCFCLHSPSVAPQLTCQLVN